MYIDMINVDIFLSSKPFCRPSLHSDNSSKTRSAATKNTLNSVVYMPNNSHQNLKTSYNISCKNSKKVTPKTKNLTK